MAGIAVQWSYFGNFDSFNVYRSAGSPLDRDNLPAPIAANLKTMFYVDTEVVWDEVCYYLVEVVKGSLKEKSDVFSQLLIFNAPTNLVGYWKNSRGGVVLKWGFEE